MQTSVLRVSPKEIFFTPWLCWSRSTIVKSRSHPQITIIRRLTKSSKRSDSTSAPNLGSNLNKNDDIIVDEIPYQSKVKIQRDEFLHARIVPESRSYFTVQPTFTDSLVALDQILENYKNLPLSDPNDVPKVAWLSGRDYRNMIGEPVKTSRYQHMLRVLKRLNQIHPVVMPPEVKQAMKPFQRNVIPETSSTKISAIDELGRSLGIGRRKTSIGKAWLVEGTGEVFVNGKTLCQAFGRVHDRETVIWPLKVTQRVNKYNLWCRAQGGGTTGQAEALTLAVAKALLGHEPALKPALRRAGCVTRDPRKVERKKPGHLKARKMPAWVKR